MKGLGALAVLVVVVMIATGADRQSGIAQWWNGLTPERAARVYTENPDNAADFPPHSVVGFYVEWVSGSEAVVILHALSSALGTSGGWAYATLYVARQGGGPWTVRRVLQPLTDWDAQRFTGRLLSAWPTASPSCDEGPGGQNDSAATAAPPEFTGPFAVCLSIDFPARPAGEQRFIVVGRIAPAGGNTAVASDAALLVPGGGARSVRLDFSALAAGEYRVYVAASGSGRLAEVPVVVKRKSD